MQNVDASRIRDFISERVTQLAAGRVIVHDKLHLIDSGLLDSMGLVMLITAIEERFNLEVNLADVDPDEFLTVGGLAGQAARNRAGGAAN